MDTPVRSVAVSSDGRTVYIGTDVGVYSSSDGGVHWAPFGSGLPNAQVTELELVPGTNILAAATFGRGLWEVSIPNPAGPKFDGAIHGLAPAVQNMGDQVAQAGGLSYQNTDPTTIQSVLNLPQTFNNLANQLEGPATIMGSAAPSSNIPATQLVVSINNLTPVIV